VVSFEGVRLWLAGRKSLRNNWGWSERNILQRESVLRMGGKKKWECTSPLLGPTSWLRGERWGRGGECVKRSWGELLIKQAREEEYLLVEKGLKKKKSSKGGRF